MGNRWLFTGTGAALEIAVIRDSLESLGRHRRWSPRDLNLIDGNAKLGERPAYFHAGYAAETTHCREEKHVVELLTIGTEA